MDSWRGREPRCSATCKTGEMQIKATTRRLFTPTGWQNPQTRIISSAGKDIQHSECFHAAGVGRGVWNTLRQQQCTCRDTCTHVRVGYRSIHVSIHGCANLYMCYTYVYLCKHTEYEFAQECLHCLYGCVYTRVY